MIRGRSRRVFMSMKNSVTSSSVMISGEDFSELELNNSAVVKASKS